MKDFKDTSSDSIIYKNEFFFVMKDAYPVSPGHLLIVSNNVRKDYFELSDQEKKELTGTIDVAKKLIEKEFNPDGYNIGFNCGEAAGQTVFHFHCHLIPRYYGDMDNPRGGIRHCISGKGYY
jgi:diadenosine tetraphosphate (Ap4A) HIT family hydrolase